MTSTYMTSSMDSRLINFNAPKYLINNFDNLVRFKRVSRTSMLIHLMDWWMRKELKEMEKDNTFNKMLDELSQRNQQTMRESFEDTQLPKVPTVEDDWEPPMIPSFNDEDDGWGGERW